MVAEAEAAEAEAADATAGSLKISAKKRRMVGSPLLVLSETLHLPSLVLCPPTDASTPAGTNALSMLINPRSFHGG